MYNLVWIANEVKSTWSFKLNQQQQGKSTYVAGGQPNNP